MSRTYKDRPRWVKERDRSAYAEHDHRLNDCDLPDKSTLHHGSDFHMPWTHCDWNASDDNCAIHWYLSVPKGYAHLAWCIKSRARVRTQCQVAKQIINANRGEVLADYLDELDIDVSDHRHNAAWLYW